MNKLVDTREALAVSIYAFRLNSNMVLKDLHKFGQDNTFPNKSYLIKYFSSDPIYPEILDFTITEDLLIEADKIKQELEYSAVMATLKQGKQNPFVRDCVDIVSHEKIRTKDFGILVWIPKIVLDSDRKNTAMLASARLEYSSKYIGKTNDRIQLHFNLIEKRYIGSINCWSAYGHTDDGNLVKFLTKYEDLCTTGMIKGRIKSTDTDSYRNNAQVTSLNHVKKL